MTQFKLLTSRDAKSPPAPAAPFSLCSGWKPSRAFCITFPGAPQECVLALQGLVGQALFGKQGWDWGRGGTGRAGPRLPLPFSNDSWAVMLEGASGIDHLLQQAHFTSAISETGSGQSQSSVGGRGPITHAHSRGHVCPSRAPRVPAFIKTLMLGKIEGKRRREWQRMRWLDSITYSMDMNLGNSRR